MSDVELTVRMLNINHGHNFRLMERGRSYDESAVTLTVIRHVALKD